MRAVRLLAGVLALFCASPLHAQVAYPPSATAIADVVQYIVPTSGQTIVMPNGMSALVLQPAGLLASLTVTLPSAPIDGQRIVITSTAAITILTVNGGTIYGGLSSFTLNGYERFIYSASLGGWSRSG